MLQELIFENLKIIIPIIICIIIIIIAVYTNTNKNTTDNEHKEEYSNDKCVCVFDLDDTITCSLDKAKAAINKCKSHGCDIAFNTARTIKYYADINTKYLGLSEKDFEHFYTGDHDKLDYTPTEKGLHNHIADTKVKHLYTIKEKFKVKDPKKIILFDDNYLNITKAKSHGFSSIHANDIICGLNFNVVSDIEDILVKDS